MQDRSTKLTCYVLLLTILSSLLACISKVDKIEIDLISLADKNELKAEKRKFFIDTDSTGKFLSIEQNNSEGAVWLPVKPFRTGKIEVLVRGRDELQGSFMGIFFHAKDTTAFDRA